jgi:hypothetical protein
MAPVNKHPHRDLNSAGAFVFFQVGATPLAGTILTPHQPL